METKSDLKTGKNHTLTLENRTKAVLSGVEKVINSSDTCINLVTFAGGLSIAGKDFKIERFSIEDGCLTLSGTIDTVKYTAQKSPLLKRLFK